MIVLQNNQNNATCNDTEVCPTLPAAMGMGGGYVPMIVIEGTGFRPSHHGDGYKESDVMYTLNCVETHSVCYAVYNDPTLKIDENEIGFSLRSRDYKDPMIVAYEEK